MSAVAVLLIAIGIADAVRRVTRAAWIAPTTVPVVVVACAALAGLWHLGDLPLLVIVAGAGVGWVVLGARSDRSGDHQSAPLMIFGLALAALIMLSGWGSEVDGLVARWAQWVDLPGIGDMGPDRVLMVVGVVLLQIITGNQLVRLVLGSVGAVKPEGQPQPSDRLKGGRLLGPMERILILGLGLAGQLAAATAVVAAKSVIRFPEINAAKARENGNIGIDAVTEYFLVGSFASWIIALGGLALAL
ncbi:hypothetical protein [Mycobacterium sp. ITM-2016-00318]|uniref:hypothetical protein n=1 Tax=Mycobacterium sp. ITM-2016-00318 TaxID=2099693 RepID=UPI000CF920A6|nr:hypothetical protein [Mycobacterium sp. ITM-2016-00318]WNG92397.1 hypothetical protein C6A82_023830 [Mycobacterium sp. ITM-2016-00318]